MENRSDQVRVMTKLILYASSLFVLFVPTTGHDLWFHDGEYDPFDALNMFSFSTENMTSSTRYLIYDVNPGEGFNLRRDVYIRVANLVQYLNKRGEQWILVLPPWTHLHHWRTPQIQQEGLQWQHFFDLKNMNRYIPIMEFDDFMKFEGYHGIDHILYLQRHPDAWKHGWKEMIETDRCREPFTYHLDEQDLWRGYFWKMKDVFALKHDCVSVQGRATVLADYLQQITARSVMIERFERLLHVEYGSLEFFRARRSLVFARWLRDEGNAFRLKYLESNDEDDHTHFEEDWRKQVPEYGHANGGPFIGLHMRRGDFAIVYNETIPSIEEIGIEVDRLLEKYKVKKLYVSTDATDDEVDELNSYVRGKIYRFPRTREIVEKYKDGGVAIIDQWIVSHARHFIGTCQSTFSFRIHEERDIQGFREETTYNCICGKQSPKGKCGQPSKWRVKFG